MKNYIKELRSKLGSQPIIMTGAGTLLTKNKNQILLIHRSDNNTWGIPGGALELGESLEEAAIREMREETNLEISNLKLFKVFSGQNCYYKYPNGDEVYNVIALYTTDKYSGKITPDNKESTDAKFFNVNNLPKSINPVDINIIDEFINQFYK
jgi:ADP-ribose pyrophosphatase YjhB (NUDIX family)